MPEETQAVSSPAEVEDVFKGEHVSLSEFSQYRKDGALPDRFKPAAAESAPDDTLEETEKPEAEEPEPAPDSEPEDNQEPKPKSKYEKRVLQLLAEKKELERKLAEKQDVKPESSPAPATTRNKPTAEDKKEDGTPKYSTYEDFVEELADWKAEQRMETAKREQVQQEAQKALKSKLDEARARYDDADDVIFPANQAIQNAKIPVVVKEVFGQSDVFVDLCYVVGSDPEELKKFISLAQTNPRAAIGKVFEYERGIREEFSKDDAPRDDKGKFVAPEPKKTNAPKPPSPVGGASSRAFDVSDESLSPEQWALKRNQDLQKRNG